MLRFLLVLVFVGLIAAWLLGYIPGQPAQLSGSPEAAETDRPIDPEAARQRGAEVAGQVAEGVNRLAQGVDDAALTTKITSKMALDDLVRARNIDVDSRDGIVTLSGRVGSEAERVRALQLARQTAGVTSVTDRLVVER
jgi:hyperosmotically inducible protein